MQKYQKKPVVIEAVQFLDAAENLARLSEFAGDTIRIDYADRGNPVLKVETPGGTVEARLGDWIIKGVEGEFYPCTPDIFAATYAPAIEEATVGRLTFGQAIEALKAGYRVARAGWNGRGMFVYKMDGYPDGVVANPETRAKTRLDAVIVRPYLAMLDATGQIVPGWLASQTDMLAEDWEVVA